MCRLTGTVCYHHLSGHSPSGLLDTEFMQNTWHSLILVVSSNKHAKRFLEERMQYILVVQMKRENSREVQNKLRFRVKIFQMLSGLSLAIKLVKWEGTNCSWKQSTVKPSDVSCCRKTCAYHK